MADNWQITLNLGEKISGRDLLVLLEKIDEHGSLNRAAEAAGMSYRYGWDLLKRAETALDTELVVRRTGGSSGGGSTLTKEGLLLLGHMRTLQREVQGQFAALLTPQAQRQTTGYLLLASTMEPVVTGLLDVLEQRYLQETGVMVRHIAAGSGQALDMAKAGRADIVLAHAPEAEESFVREGWGVFRLPVMTNKIVFVGPRSDPAGIGTATSAAEAVERIARSQAVFVSRGDRSGTHLFEQKIWRQAGLDPEGRPWYRIAVNTLGNYGLLRQAEIWGAYTVVDRASFVAGYRGDALSELYDPQLVDLFSVIPVSRRKAAVNQEEAEKFARWLSSPAAGEIIGGFGCRQYGFPLFVPVTQPAK